MKSKIRTYSELIALPTFEERFRYLKLNGKVGETTFGYNRIFNQQFYTSTEWRQFRNHIILRDHGCDLGVEGHEIQEGMAIYIHHLNPISLTDIQQSTDMLLNPENVITTILNTHNAIHYGDFTEIDTFQERSPNDTCPWKR